MDYLKKIILYIFALIVFGMGSVFIQALDLGILALVWLVGYYSSVLYLANQKGRSKLNWFLVSTFLTPFGGLSIILFNKLSGTDNPVN